ncbi:MAG: selenium-binding family protein [Tannerella sp.]|jgi:hypothetical protein|nr:selenium-binding family protein [Tannerella sp.]
MGCGRASNELRVYDISDPYNPELAHTERLLGLRGRWGRWGYNLELAHTERGFMHPRGLGIDGNRLFITGCRSVQKVDGVPCTGAVRDTFLRRNRAESDRTDSDAVFKKKVIVP